MIRERLEQKLRHAFSDIPTDTVARLAIRAVHFRKRWPSQLGRERTTRRHSIAGSSAIMDPQTENGAEAAQTQVKADVSGLDDQLTEDMITSNWEEAVASFDDMGLRDDLLRGIYAYGFEKPSAIQQRGIVPIVKVCVGHGIRRGPNGPMIFFATGLRHHRAGAVGYGKDGHVLDLDPAADRHGRQGDAGAAAGPDP